MCEKKLLLDWQRKFAWFEISNCYKYKVIVLLLLETWVSLFEYLWNMSIFEANLASDIKSIGWIDISRGISDSSCFFGSVWNTLNYKTRTQFLE